MKWAFWLIGALAGSIIAYGTYMRRIDPPEVIGQGHIDVAASNGGAVKVKFRTRTIKGGGLTTDQVELPGGTWIDCGGDCRDAVDKATIGFWDLTCLALKYLANHRHTTAGNHHVATAHCTDHSQPEERLDKVAVHRCDDIRAIPRSTSGRRTGRQSIWRAPIV